MNKFRPVMIGLVSGSIAVLSIWLTRVVLPPRQASLPAVIRLDTLDAYSARPSKDANVLLDEARLLERVVGSFKVSSLSRIDAVSRLAEAAHVNIVVDQPAWLERAEQQVTRTLISLSVEGKTVDQILERIFEDLAENNFERPIWFAREGIIVIASRSHHNAAANALRIYDVTDLMIQSRRISSGFAITTQPSTDKWDAILHGSEQEAAERLITWVRGGKEVRDNDELKEIHYFAGKLLVNGTREFHRQVEERLAILRKSK